MMKIQEFIVDDETLVKVGNQSAWPLWVVVDSINKLILRIIPEFISKNYGKDSLSTHEGGTWYSYTLVNSWEDRTSYIHLTYEKKASLLKEQPTINHKDRTEAFLLMITSL